MAHGPSCDLTFQHRRAGARSFYLLKPSKIGPGMTVRAGLRSSHDGSSRFKPPRWVPGLGKEGPMEVAPGPAWFWPGTSAGDIAANRTWAQGDEPEAEADWLRATELDLLALKLTEC